VNTESTITHKNGNSGSLRTGRLARLFGVADKTVVKWIDSGMLLAHRLPGTNDRRVAMRDALAFAAKHHLEMEPLIDHAQAAGYLPLCPRALLVSANAPLSHALACNKIEITIAPNILQCGISLAHRHFHAAILDCLFGRENIALVGSYLHERAPSTLVGLLAAEDHDGQLPLGVTIAWPFGTPPEHVARDIGTCLAGEVKR